MLLARRCGLQKDAAFTRLLLDHGADPNARVSLRKRLRFIADESQHAALHDAARQKLRGHFERLDAQLANRDWLAGHRSVADAYLFVVLRWAKAKQVDLHGLEHLEAFCKRLHADPGVKAVMQAEGI